MTDYPLETSQSDLAAVREAAAIERRRRQWRDRIERLLYFVSPLALIVLWEAVTWSKLVDTRFFPRPSLVLL